MCANFLGNEPWREFWVLFPLIDYFTPQLTAKVILSDGDRTGLWDEDLGTPTLHSSFIRMPRMARVVAPDGPGYNAILDEGSIGKVGIE